MGKRASLTTQEYLVNAALPEATETYTVIPHGSVIERTKTALQSKGFGIERELYRCNQGAQIAQGVYHLKYGGDPDMSMMFAWSNSYDKTMKFKCSIGGYVHTSLSAIIGHQTAAAWDRKHTGTADNEAFEMIDNQIEKAEEYFRDLVNDKEIMKQVPVTEQVRAELMGRLYFVHELLTSEQLSTVRNQFNKPSFTCSGMENSLWSMYNGIILSLQQAHPKTWMDQQRMIHWFLCDHFNIKSGALSFISQNGATDESPAVDPNQLNIIDEIAKKEASPVEQLREESEQELSADASHMLHGVNNDNAEASFTVQPKIVPTENVITYTIDPADLSSAEPITVEEDLSWPCLGCGQPQGPEDAFHDGQLCTSCNSIKIENESDNSNNGENQQG